MKPGKYSETSGFEPEVDRVPPWNGRCSTLPVEKLW